MAGIPTRTRTWSDEDHGESMQSYDDEPSLGDANDYWFGKSFFLHQIARQAFYGDAPASPSMDITIDTAVRRFPYQLCLMRLRAAIDLSWPADNDADQTLETTFVSSIGTACRIGGIETERTIIQVLDEFRPWTISAVSITDRGWPAHGMAAPLPNIARDASGAQYSMMWKEYLDTRGETVVYDYRRLTERPEVFEASLVHKGQKFRGLGTRHKFAQHAAAQHACEAFAISERSYLGDF